jgi:Flp pilus assembly protein TadG
VAGQADRGAVAVETAIVLPLLLLLIFGLIDFGRLLNAQITLTEAAREAARAESVGGDPVARADAAAGDLGVTVHVDRSCPTPVDTAQDAQVTVRYTFTFVTPFGSLAALLGGSAPKGTVVLTGRALTACQ